jgi:DNA modification methylase
MTERLKMESRKSTGSIECLGMTFSSEHERRQHFLALLAEKLKDPTFREQEGFPDGSDEAILALSDPPYYTACPNPWMTDFVHHFGTPFSEGDDYFRLPFATDVTEGKNHPIYNAHSYHTKVPHRAIVRYMMHYTKPNDVVLDAFGGTGMTAVAAAACGNSRELIECGYTIVGSDAKDGSGQVSQIGPRSVVVSDLSPIATFISSNLNRLPDSQQLIEAADDVLAQLRDVEDELYLTEDSDGHIRGRVNYIVWSDCYSCQECGSEYDYWSEAVELGSGEAAKTFECPSCGATQNTRNLQRAYTSFMDPILRKPVRLMKQIPVHINYFNEAGKKARGQLSSYDFNRAMTTPDFTNESWWCRASELTRGDRYRRDAFEDKGVTHAHHFYTWRNLKAIFSLLEAIRTSDFEYPVKQALLFVVTSFADRNGTKRNRFVINKYNPSGRINGPMANTLYLPNLFCEVNIFDLFREKLKDVVAASNARVGSAPTLISTSTATNMMIADNSIDYIFTDPPFGHNIQYSELNSSLESIIGISTKSKEDLVVNEAVDKGIDFYRRLIKNAFDEYFRVLKPGRWITVEFSNTQAAIWNSIQTALSESGFVIASVAALDKSRGGMHATLGVTAVKQDLAITAYKPSLKLEHQFHNAKIPADNAWSFVEDYLEKIPVSRSRNREIQYVAERDPRILFDRMISWFVRHNVPVPLSSQEFQEGLRVRFAERDGMFFLPKQIAEYDRKRAAFSQAPQMELFVSDERSAIDWLTDFLRKRPSSYQDLHPEFTTQLGAGWKKHEERPELIALLEENFLRYDGTDEVPNQIHGYLSSNFKDLRGLEKGDAQLKAKAKDRWYVPDPNKAKDLEQRRERSLLKEFESYKSAPGRRLKEFRLEVLRAGFKTAWAGKDYKTIIGIAQKIPDEALQEDEKLLLWYDQALTRMEADA